mgnify:CR=1 FL=1
MMKTLVETIYTDVRHAVILAGGWPTTANVNMSNGRVEAFSIDARKVSRQCDLKALMRDLLAPAKARSVICTDGAIVYCGAIKVTSLKGGKGYKA